MNLNPTKIRIMDESPGFVMGLYISFLKIGNLNSSNEKN